METEHKERREYNLQMSQDIGEIKGMLEGLAGPYGRVTALEESAKTADNRFWLQTVVIVPLLSVFHLVARKLGF
jgi:hypothetical protein